MARELRRFLTVPSLHSAVDVTARSIRLALVWLLVLVGGSSLPAGPTGAEAAGSNSRAAAEIASLTNLKRQRAGLPALKISPLLTRAAQLHADQMASLGEMAHVLRRARYPEPDDRLAAVGYKWQAYAENVAYGQASPASAIGSWMESSGHRANILNPGLRELGTAVAYGAGRRPYWVQVFGNPR